MRKFLPLAVLALCSCGPTMVADCRVTGKPHDVVQATATIRNFSLKRIARSVVSFTTNGNGKVGSVTDYTFDTFVNIGGSAKATARETIPKELRPTWLHLGGVAHCEPVRSIYADGTTWEATPAS